MQEMVSRQPRDSVTASAEAPGDSGETPANLCKYQKEGRHFKGIERLSVLPK